MVQTAYVAPSSLRETLRFLEDTDHQSVPLAGGTQLLVDLRNDASQPGLLVDLRHLEMLKHIRLRAHSLEIGGLVTLAQVERDELILQHVPLLAEMAKYFGNPLIRAAASLGGNIASSHTQVTDAVVPLLALDAKLLLQSSKGEDYQQRTLSIDEFVRQSPPTGELISQITVPVMPTGAFAFYYKLGNRRAGAVPIASVTVIITSQHQRISGARIALGAIALTPLRAIGVESSLRGEILPLGESVINQCIDKLAEELPEPLHDIWASASYRVMMGKALVKKALRQARPVNNEHISKGEIDDR
jgi:CO/xanthine dehydrogenase FAD-binding subunit